MADVLITGGTGHLGGELVDLLVARGAQVRVLARRPGARRDVDWVRGDLATGAGVADAVAGVHTVVHAATHSPAAQRGRIRPVDLWRSPSDVDVDGTHSLLGAARDAGVRHLCHVSIVGVQRSRLPYSRRKAHAEDLVRAGDVPWTIAPATGFYWLLARLFEHLPRRLWLLPSNLPMQPCDSAEFAAYLADRLDGGPAGSLPGFGGPETLSMAELAHQYRAARGGSARILPVRLPRAALRWAGPQTCPDGHAGTVTWADWLAGR